MKKLFLILLLVIPFYAGNSLAQTSDVNPAPREFGFLTPNSKATTKSFTFSVTPESSSIDQNFNLDVTGTILHNPLMIQMTEILLLDQNNNEIQYIDLEDGTLFALLESDKSYKVIQSITPECSNLIMGFDISETEVLCPDKVLIKVIDELMVVSDVSLQISDLMLTSPNNTYLLGLSVPESTVQFNNFPLLEISEANTSFNAQVLEDPITEPTNNDEENNSDSGEDITDLIDSILNQVNIANLLSKGKLCIVSRAKAPQKKDRKKLFSRSCQFDSPDIQTIVVYENDLRNKDLTPKQVIRTTIDDEGIAKSETTHEIDLIFPFLNKAINRLNNEVVLNIKEDIETVNEPTELLTDSTNKFLFESGSYEINYNLGKINKQRERIKKRKFKLKNPVTANGTLKKTTFNTGTTQSNVIINPFTDATQESFLTNISYELNESNDGVKNIKSSLKNNIVLRNQLDLDSNISSKVLAQTTENENLTYKAFIPEGTFDSIFTRTYSSIEQNIAPSVDETTGANKLIVNDKSRLDLTIQNTSEETNPTSSDTVTIQSTNPETVFNNSSFMNQLMSSGFLIPPDFRPIVEDGYRATISFTMSIITMTNDTININYQELQTKDEVSITNFFNFSFLPLGDYDVDLKFNANRRKNFQTLGITIPPECSDNIDNDGDGLINLDDPGCLSENDDNERDPLSGPACDNGIDDDNDGFFDFPDDKGCSSPEDNDETPTSNNTN